VSVKDFSMCLLLLKYEKIKARSSSDLVRERDSNPRSLRSTGPSNPLT
jgi:hypothetical protein